MLNVAVVGSGPAGLYAAEALVKQAAALPVPVPVRVDVIDRLPTPYGLVRYGVAPDHKSIKSIAQYLRKVLESPDVRFVGGVHLGEDVTRDDLVSAYDAVIYATGAMRDRRLGIPGEDLPGSYAATDFVNWYCGHPDMDSGAFTLDAESVAVIGVGNVAVDVARILARDPDELHATDVPQPVLDALHASKVREVHMIGRRGPAHAKFTTKELRELGELPGVELVVHADEADLNAFDLAGEGVAMAESDRRVRGNLVAITKWAQDGFRPFRTARVHRAHAAADRPFLAAADRDPWYRTGRGNHPRAHVDQRRREIRRHRRVRDAGRADGAAFGGLPERPAARRAVRRARLGGAQRPGACPGRGRHAAARRIRGRLAQARPDRRDRHQQVRRRRDRPLPARGPGRRSRRGRRPAAASRAAALSRPSRPGRRPGGPAEEWPLASVLAGRGIAPVSYAEWLRIETAEAELAKELGRGERVKLHNAEAIWSACRPSAE